MIPYGRHEITEADIENVVGLMEHGLLTQGEKVPLFEKKIREITKSKYSFAVSSATSALHLTLLGLGISRGDIVWTTGISFVATANSALYCGGTIDFVDINLETFNMCVESLSEKLIDANKVNKLPKILVVVHMGGLPCEMAQIKSLCDKYDVKIVEDASHAVGSQINSSKIGSCRYSEATIFSFHPVKVITSAEGGMITTNDKRLANQVQLLRSHGITRKESEFKHQAEGPWYYEQVSLGYNFRMSDLQAVLGLSQLNRLNEIINTRNNLANVYSRDLNKQKFKIQKTSIDCKSSYHLYIIRTYHEDLESHKKWFSQVIDQGIGIQKHYIPIYRHPYYQKLLGKTLFLENCEKYYGTCASIPLFTTLSDESQRFVIEKLNTIEY